MIEIRRLTLDELGPYLEFMDGPAFKSQPQWQGCYCQFYLNTREQNADPSSVGEVNRTRACDRLADGTMQGYVALTGDRVIGWMAANSFKNFIELPGDQEDAAAIICFVVDEEFQGRGVATKMLSFALKDLPNHGYRAVSAAPLASGEFLSHGYRGPKSMFEKAGFVPGPMVDDKHVLMTKVL
ncbi:GNAT family N-acetyltransferase [Aquiluna sp. KACHI24]|uniref:GNAT family N-acetyltransferase n=1 Tax=Aquiluna sp. KACHI24 TaxID=2968831 RepID=UPI002231902C|nr:GNAT family N-acetyltransferase [Aquiluna sp. KACHI24]